MAQYYQDSKGLWKVRYWTPKDPATGKRKQVRGPQGRPGFARKSEAQDWYAEERLRLQRAQGASGEVTLAEYAATWLRGLRVRPSTTFAYSQNLRLHILPHLGAQRLDRLDVATIEAWHVTLEATLAPGTIHRIHGQLCQILRHAHTRGAIPSNPAAICWPPKAPAKPDPRGWTVDEIRRFLTVANQPEHLIYRTALLTGLRTGELLALEWRDLDLRAGTLSVRRTQTRAADGAWTTGPPKTARAHRTIALPASFARELRAHRARQNAARLEYPGWWDHDLVFAHDDGRPYHRSTLRVHFAELCRAAGLPVITIHGLRRSAATRLVALNAHPRLMMERMGHEHASMTMYYAEADAALDRAIAAQLDADLDRPAGDDDEETGRTG